MTPPSDLPSPSTFSGHSRNRAGSTSGFDLSPYRTLLETLEAEHEHDKEAQGGEDGRRKGEIKGALRMLLNHVDGLTSRLHTSLAKQLETDHQLTIARSNLVMQEANAEMLEEALRRGGEFSHALIAQTHRRSAPPQSINTSHSALASPVQIERRSTELAATTEEMAPTSSGSSGGGGWFSRRSTNKKNGFSPIPPSMSQPYSPPLNSSGSSPRRSNDIIGSSQFGSSTPNLGLGLGPISPVAMSPGAGSSFNAPTPTNGELISLRQSLAQERTQRQALAAKLKTLEGSKQELESELENLSQALFEEANKMVADERRVRLEQEEEAEEARSERDALRRTVRLVEKDCKALRTIVESLGACVPDLKSDSSPAAVDLTHSPTASTSALPPSPSGSSHRSHDRTPSPTPRKQRGQPPQALHLSPSRSSSNTNIVLSPSPTTESRRIPLRSRQTDSDTSSIHSNYSATSSNGRRSPSSSKRAALSPRGQQKVDQLGLGLGLGNEDRGREETSENRKRSGTSSSVESLSQLMQSMAAEYGDLNTPTPTSATFSQPPPPISSPRILTSSSLRSLHLSPRPPTSPRLSPSSPRSIASSSGRLSPRPSSPLPEQGSPRRALLLSQSNGSDENPWST